MPTAAEVLLIIEVADSTIDDDRDTKLPRYAHAGVAEAWLVDLNARVVEQRSDPFEDVYRRVASGMGATGR